MGGVISDLNIPVVSDVTRAVGNIAGTVTSGIPVVSDVSNVVFGSSLTNTTNVIDDGLVSIPMFAPDRSGSGTERKYIADTAPTHNTTPSNITTTTDDTMTYIYIAGGVVILILILR